MKTAATFLLAAGLALAAAPLEAQQAGAMPEAYKDVQMSALRLQRRMLTMMADSMPERLYRDKATPVQRDFAEQIMHAAAAMPMVVSSVLRVPGMGSRPDTAAIHTRAGLKALITTAYDWAEAALRNQTADARGQMVNLFGTQMPGWQVWDEMHQHTIWTAGQAVANFRKNGMAPPGFGFF